MGNYIEEPLFVVIHDDAIACASWEKCRCMGFIEFVQKDDVRFVENSFDISEDEYPFMVGYMAGQLGDAGCCELLTIRNSDIDEDGDWEHDDIIFPVSDIIDIADRCDGDCEACHKRGVEIEDDSDEGVQVAEYFNVRTGEYDWDEDELEDEDDW